MRLKQQFPAVHRLEREICFALLYGRMRRSELLYPIEDRSLEEYFRVERRNCNAHEPALFKHCEYTITCGVVNEEVREARIHVLK